MVRPSYVLGVVQWKSYIMKIITRLYEPCCKSYTRSSCTHRPLYAKGTEVEVDAIADGETVVIPGIMEHIERAGVHSGDSIAVYPPQTLSSKVIFTIC